MSAWRTDGRLWIASTLLLLLGVLGSALAIRSSPDPSSMARWLAVAGVLVGTIGVLVARPPFSDRRRRLATVAVIGLLLGSAYFVGRIEVWPQQGVLDPALMEPRSLLINVHGDARPSQRFHIEVYAPPDRNSRASRLRLFEDGEALGPSNTRISLIAQWGLGAYQHKEGALSFSTSDGSDPRTNGRVYEYVRYAAVPDAVLVILLGGLALALRRWLREEHSGSRPVIAAVLVAATSVLALNALSIDDAPLNIKDARQNLEMAQTIATTREARSLDWLLSQRREPLPNLVLAAQMRLDPRLDGIRRGESVQAPEFQVALKQNTLLYVALLYTFGLLSIRRMFTRTNAWLPAFALFVVLAHLLFLQHHEYINRNYTEVHAAAFLLMSGYFLLRYAETRTAREAFLAVGALVALALTKGLFAITLLLTLVVLLGGLLRRRILVRGSPLRRVILAAVTAAAVLAASGIGALAVWGAQLSNMPTDPEVAASQQGFSMGGAIPGRAAVPVHRSFWNVRDGETLRRRLARNTPPLIRADAYRVNWGYEVGSERIPAPAIWWEPRFASRREAQAAALAVFTYNSVRDPVATVATALSVAALFSVAPRSVELSDDQRDRLRVLMVVLFFVVLLRHIWYRDSTLWFYLPTLIGMASYAFLAHGRYRYWAPFVPIGLIATAVGLVLLVLAAERWLHRVMCTRQLQEFRSAIQSRFLDSAGRPMTRDASGEGVYR